MNRRRLGLLAVPALLILLAGCGEGVRSNGEQVGAGDVDDVTDDPAAAAAFLAESADATEAVESGRVEMTLSSDDGSLPETTMTGEFADGGDAAHMTMDAGPVQAEITVIDGVTYTETAGQCFQETLPEGFDELAEQRGAVTDPGPLLDLLGGVDEGVTDEGRVDVRGVETTQFSGSFTMQDALDQLEGSERDGVESLLGTAGLPEGFLDTEFPISVFIDDEGLVRRMEMTLDYSAVLEEEVDGIALPSATMAYDLFDLGADVVIEAPADCDDELPTPGDFGSDQPFDPDEFEEFCQDSLEDLPDEAVEQLPEGFDPCEAFGDEGTVGS